VYQLAANVVPAAVLAHELTMWTACACSPPLNQRVKHREPFRPFAPAVLEEHAAGWFGFDDTDTSSPFMLRVLPVNAALRDRVPGIVHLDGTARVQTVGAERPALRAVLERFYAKTGVPMLINTSFNVMGEPIVETPLEAIDCLLETDIDVCVLEGRLVRRDAALGSMLEMYPVKTLRELSIVPAEASGSNGGGSSSQIAFTVETPYGTVRRTASLSFARLLARCDGTRSGMTILGELRQSGQHLTTEGFERLLSQLRRMGAIRYAKSSTAAPADALTTAAQRSE
jgi:carbamoyltransferase